MRLVKALFLACVGLVLFAPVTGVLLLLGVAPVVAIGVLAAPLLAVLAVLALPVIIVLAVLAAVAGLVLGLAAMVLKLALFVLVPAALVYYAMKWLAARPASVGSASNRYFTA